MSNLKQRIYTVLNNGRTPTDTTTGTTDNASATTEEVTFDAEKANQQLADIAGIVNSNGDITKINTQIFGMPHQFLESTDGRLSGYNVNIGYEFFNKIYLERPIVTLMPGKMLYLPNYKNRDKQLFGSLSIEASDNQASKDALAELISEEAESRYYDFTSDYVAYMNYVNLMCRVAAVYLRLDEPNPVTGEKRTAPDGGKYSTYDWKKYHSVSGYTDKFEDSNKNILSHIADFFKTLKDDLLVGQRSYVNFYIDPNTSVNESIGNTTQASQLEGLFDSTEGIVKEAQMLINSVGGNTITDIVDSATGAVADLANTATLGLFSDMIGLGKEVLHGSNLVYPEIWTDSEYGKSFSIQINLASPYGDTESIYLNILVPMFHALCLALPRQSSANSFNSPFLIRGYCQGWFSIDMGMVDSITIDKGPEQSWNVQGLPTQVKITLSIKELYGNLMMSPSTKPSYFFANQGLIDYLGCTCGVDMTMPNIYFKFNLVAALISGNLQTIPANTYYKLTENFRNWVKNKLS